MFLALALSMAAPSAEPPAPSSSDCRAALQVRKPSASRRPVESTDLIETLDIGSNGGMESEPILAISPDHTRVAVAVRRADVVSNDYCTGVYVIDRAGDAALVDHGPGVAFFRYDNFYGMNGFTTGVTKIIPVRWSPDGTRLAFLKFVNGKLRLWGWTQEGGSRELAKADGDIIDFRFAGAGTILAYRIRDEAAQQAQLREEGLGGYHYDDRFVPFAAHHPFAAGPPDFAYRAVELDSLVVREAASEEIALFEQHAADGERAGVKTDGTGKGWVVASAPDGTIECTSVACSDVVDAPWLTPAGRIRYLRREGRGRSLMAIYEWQPGPTAPRRLFQTSDLLTGCTPVDNDLLCAREQSRRPAYLDRIELPSGKSAELWDPNPVFSKLDLGRVERLQWKNDRGVEIFGDLAYPPDFRRGQRYPLIVVQYESRGFLRGGTGDEYPIQLFAKAGYLVLSVQRPASPFAGRGLPLSEQQLLDYAGFAERRSILSAIEAKVSQLVAAGLVDAGKVGITGLSDGSTTVQFAALHSKMFKAASVSGAGWEPSQTWILGPAIQKSYERLGWPASPDDPSPMWSDMSLTRNADRVAFPILIQASDGEFTAMLEAFRALRAAKRPVDLFVFPDEVHIKRQPAHRDNIYRRNIRWFDFWLLGKSMGDGDALAAETARWKKMKATAP
jgi:dipeptidyl aminopeptidase/acylaminoacyl peptidase